MFCEGGSCCFSLARLKDFWKIPQFSFIVVKWWDSGNWDSIQFIFIVISHSKMKMKLVLFASNDNVGEFKGRKKVGQTQTFQFRMSYNYFLSVCWPFYSLFWGCCLLSTHPHQAFNNLFISTERPDSSSRTENTLTRRTTGRALNRICTRGREKRREEKKSIISIYLQKPLFTIFHVIMLQSLSLSLLPWTWAPPFCRGSSHVQDSSSRAKSKTQKRLSAGPRKSVTHGDMGKNGRKWKISEFFRNNVHLFTLRLISTDVWLAQKCRKELHLSHSSALSTCQRKCSLKALKKYLRNVRKPFTKEHRREHIN